MSTTASAKQQELEEQLARLLSMMELRQQRQEQLAQEQQQRQDEQFGRLLEEQQQQGKLLMKQQREAEEQMGALKDDLEQTKGAMEGRFLATEASLEGMHRELTEKLQAGQASLRKELQEELRTELRELRSSEEERRREPRAETGPFVPLRPSAAEFIPSMTPLPTGTDGSVSRAGATQRPPLYDGRSSWDAYITQFEMLAQLNHWTEMEKATLLAVSLRGAASTVLSNLPADRRSDYRALVTALENRFGTAHQAELHRMKLRNRTRKREESLAELMEDIERLARLAYPDAAPAMLELLAKDQFIDSLTDEDTKLRIRQNRPETLQQALEAALELESYQLASRHRAIPVRSAQLDCESGYTQSRPWRRTRPSGVSYDVLEELQQCVNRMQQLFQECMKSQGQRSPTKRNSRRSPQSRKQLTCWSCGEAGHIRRNCKKGTNKSTPPRAESEKLSRQISTPTENLTTSVVHGAENPFAVGSVEDHPCHLTIDTGSNISIIRPDVLSKQKQTLIQPVSQSIRTVTGEKVPIQGKGDLCVKIGSQEGVHPMWVADIQDECILGLDFLELHGCMVDFGDNVLHISGEEIPLQKMGSCSLAQVKAYRTVLDTTVSLPPHSECVAKVAELQSGGAKELHRLNTTSALQGVLVGRMWVDSHKPKAKSVCNNLEVMETELHVLEPLS